MKPRIYHFNGRLKSLTVDKVEKVLPVDQFNCKDFNLNKFGHPKSDLTLLIEYSQSHSQDLSKFTEFAQRIHMLKAEKPNNKTVEQLIHEWRPCWMQTISEEQRFAEWYYHEFDEKVDSTPFKDEKEPPVSSEASPSE